MNHAKLIRSNYIFLIENIDCQSLLSYLLADDVISSTEIEDITSQRTSRRQTQKLLSLIAMKPSELFERFLEALNRTSQSFVSKKIKCNSSTGNYRLLRY